MFIFQRKNLLNKEIENLYLFMLNMLIAFFKMKENLASLSLFKKNYSKFLVEFYFLIYLGILYFFLL